MPKFTVNFKYPTVIVYAATVEADDEQSAIEIAKEQDNWEQVEMDAPGLCHHCSGAAEYYADREDD